MAQKVRLYYGSGTGGPAAYATQTLRVDSPDGSSFLCEMTSWPPSWNYDVISEIRLVNRCVFTWRTILPNFIPILFETTEPYAFYRGSIQEEE